MKTQSKWAFVKSGDQTSGKCDNTIYAFLAIAEAVVLVCCSLCYHEKRWALSTLD